MRVAPSSSFTTLASPAGTSSHCIAPAFLHPRLPSQLLRHRFIPHLALPRPLLFPTVVSQDVAVTHLIAHAPSLSLSDVPHTTLDSPQTSLDCVPDASYHEQPSDEESVEVDTPLNVSFAKEISRRRNFAIISHPDAGKTTLTEKLLLYGGAIHEAGAVKARRAARHATSDWMELEKQRGISITSTALVFETDGYQITLLDTPGHQDFGEDTYRTLAAADNAVMLIDGGKGLEPQTRKLFEVCRMRKLPIFTFINKMDRPALEPLELLDEIEKEFELSLHAISWPIGSGDRFMGLYFRPRREVHLFEKDQTHGSKEASVRILSWGDPLLMEIIPEDLYQQLEEEIEILEELSPPLDIAKLHAGELSPVFFGSAMNNFGVKLFLESFLMYAQQPGPHISESGTIEPDYPEFTGFVFKLQANMDPKHRDKIAFVRVCSVQEGHESADSQNRKDSIFDKTTKDVCTRSCNHRDWLCWGCNRVEQSKYIRHWRYNIHRRALPNFLVKEQYRCCTLWIPEEQILFWQLSGNCNLRFYSTEC